MPTRAAPHRPLSRVIRAAWLIVLLMMLAAAAWSISTTLTAWGMNPELAWALSLMFDLAGLICATYARRAVERNSPAGLPRLATLGFVTVSGAVNWSHGHAIGGPVAAWSLAAISAAVELLFELHRRDVRDEHRAAAGLLPERMPHIPLLGWAMYPGRSWTTLRRAVGVRLDSLDPVQQAAPARPDATPEPGQRADGTVRAAVRAAADTLPNAEPEVIVEHLGRVGIEVEPDTVRALLDKTPDGGDADVRTLRPSLADTVRTAIACGKTEPAEVLAYAQQVHGPDVNPASVERTLRRTLRRTA
ncbi:DUF2637 domain-containing protein [Streptomyces klenkii]|uniref:DUF2637 domain-containing protein n=1 Tax=Streptomyces klenkii TaxID=1420899 RepID=UPI001F53EB71|nr:DUF2637 domain-containing protein [Streptomyces klenkii]